MNKIKQKLAAGRVVTMVNPDFQHPRLVEYLAKLGMDVSFIDAERMPLLVSKGVRWLNVHANAFLARGAKQYTELLKRSGP